MRTALMAMLAAIAAAAAGPAWGQSALDLASLERDPAAYVAARYAPGDAAGLRADLAAAGFQCRDGYPSEVDLIALCERMDRTSPQCFSFLTVRLTANAAPALRRAPRCMGVINPPARPSAQ